MGHNNIEPRPILPEDLIEEIGAAIMKVTERNSISVHVAGQILREVIGALEVHELKKRYGRFWGLLEWCRH